MNVHVCVCVCVESAYDLANRNDRSLTNSLGIYKGTKSR